MKIKPIPADRPVTFSPLGPPPQDPMWDLLSKEAKKLNNVEKGYRADERYLGQQQTLAQKVRKFAQTGEAPWDDADYDALDTFMDPGEWL